MTAPRWTLSDEWDAPTEDSPSFAKAAIFLGGLAGLAGVVLWGVLTGGWA